MDICDPKGIYGGPDCLVGESGMPSKWMERTLEAEERKELVQVVAPQDNPGRCWTLLACGVVFLAEEVERAKLSYRGGGEQKWWATNCPAAPSACLAIRGTISLQQLPDFWGGTSLTRGGKREGKEATEYRRALKKHFLLPALGLQKEAHSQPCGSVSYLRTLLFPLLF